MLPKLGTPTPSELVLWDIIDEHFSEAPFELYRWQRALASPKYTLDEVADGPEESLLAHLYGVLLSGEEGLSRYVLPCLEAAAEQEPRVVAVAAALAVRAGRYQDVLGGLREVAPDSRTQVAAATSFVEDPSFDDVVLQEGALELISSRRLRFEGLGQALESGDTAVRSAAARAALFADRTTYLPLIQANALEGDADALRLAVAWGSKPALRYCVELAHRSAADDSPVLDIVAIAGGPEEHQLLMEQACKATAPLSYAAIRALGLTENAEVVPILLEAMASENLKAARLAGEAFCMITGLSVGRFVREEPAVAEDEAREQALPDFEDDDLDEDLIPSAEEDLRLLDARQVQEWWERKPMSHEPRQFFGQKPGRNAYLNVLRRGTMRGHRAASELLFFRSGGAHSIQRGPTALQRREIAVIESSPDAVRSPSGR